MKDKKKRANRSFYMDIGVKLNDPRTKREDTNASQRTRSVTFDKPQGGNL